MIRSAWALVVPEAAQALNNTGAQPTRSALPGSSTTLAPSMLVDELGKPVGDPRAGITAHLLVARG